MKWIVITSVASFVLWFAPIFFHQIRWRRWRALPDHNPYKPGDSQ
jgi:hypothetical protein